MENPGAVTFDVEPAVPPPSGIPVEPAAAPPPKSDYADDLGPVGGAQDGGWWDAAMNLTVCGKRISHSTAKTVIYGGAAAIGIVLVVLVVQVINSDTNSDTTDGDPIHLRSQSADLPTNVTHVEEHTGVWASVWYALTTDASGERQGTYRIQHGSECELFSRRRAIEDGGGRVSGRCGLTQNGQVFAWYQSVHAGEDPNCDGMHMGPPVRSGCSRTPRLPGGYYVECCVALDNVGDPTCPADEMLALTTSQSDGCSPSPPVTRPTQPAPPPPSPPYRPIRGCMDEHASNYNRLARLDDGSCTYAPPPPQATQLGCMDEHASNYDPTALYSTGGCIYPPPMPPPPPPPPPAPVVTGGTGSLAGGGTVGGGCCSSQTCECEGLDSCTVVTDAPFEWVDIMDTATQITSEQWQNNGDDGWFHVDLPFNFHWFGTVERTITIGTNGVLSFGDDQLPYGDSEPVPCQWNGGGQGAGLDGCVQNGDAAATTGGHYDVEIDGIIAVFWCDLNPDAVSAPGEGVFYTVVHSEDVRLIAFNKLIVEYNVPVFGTHTYYNFEVILAGDGSVLLQYRDMPVDSGSWSTESIGFEDQTGTKGVQISYGQIPPAETAYSIPPTCHVGAGEGAYSTCCTSQICQCEGTECMVNTDFGFAWVDITSEGRQITSSQWQNNVDDGWFHVDLPFEFNWFGTIERTVTIGTNGVLTFGDDQLPYGDSEPVPCQWNGGGQGAGSAGCVQDGGGVSGGHYGVDSIEGIIAVFWCDLNPDAAGGAGEGVYYQIVTSNDARAAAWNKIIVEYNVPVFGTSNMCHFEVILAGDGSVVLQYLDMPTDGSGSWARESIGFEDQSGTRGVQISYGTVPAPRTAYQIPPACHVEEGDASCCTSQLCQCEGLECTIDTSYDINWVDLIGNGLSTQITVWEGNRDDGWFHLDIGFDFHWFGTIERTITIGTNGVLTFGDDQLPYGDTEPVPCQWNGGGQGAGSAGCVQDGGGVSGDHYGVDSIEGIIAVFWCDLNPDAAGGEDEGVWYQIVTMDDERLAAFNKLTVEYKVQVFGNAEALCHFEVILMGDGSVLMQYLHMPAVTGSWSSESIGFEDRSGTQGAQLLYGSVPGSGTAYYIPPVCHDVGGADELEGCCTDQICECEGLDDDMCVIETDYPYAWVDIVPSATNTDASGTQITLWEGNRDDGWFHVDLPFQFNWFGSPESRVTIGTNGALTFGQDQLPYGDSEPVPCQWNGGGQGAGQAGCVQNGGGEVGDHYGVDSIEGIIAVFWCDLNPDAAGGEGEGVWYQVVQEDTSQRFLMIYNQLIVTYNIPVFGTTNYCQFQVILRGEGDVLMQYKDMPSVTGSWSEESIGFEDATGTMGAQISYGAVPAPRTAYYIPNTCHVLEGEMSGCCSTRYCACEGNLACVVETDFGYSWEDIIDNDRGTQITDWTNGADDGWKHIDLPFDFNWYGLAETTITVGTNGMLGFGQQLLPYGDSEPVPCQWNGGAQGAGRAGCVGYDPDASDTATTGGHYGVEIDGIIAPFWADLNPGDATGGCVSQRCGVYYYIAQASDITLAAFNKVIIEYRANVWQTGQDHVFDDVPCHFEVILFGDGTVVFQYHDMPATSGSWSKESIGFEDRSGTQGVQISYGEVPVAETAYQIPPTCHVEAGLPPAESCCTSLPCQCESVDCSVATDFPYEWNGIASSGTLIEDGDWEGNSDDGWFHVDLSWDFHWFGMAERRITIGTNGVMTFGSAQLRNGASEPVPCAWVGGGAIQGGQAVDGCVGVNYGSSGTNNGVSPDGVIAPFWADLTTENGENSVYYQLVESTDARMLAFNKLVVEWNVHVWNGSDEPCHFQAVLSGDGSVLFQYESMPTDDSGSWSEESVGIEDQTGNKGIQISYGEIPQAGTAYYIPPSCHVVGGEDARSCTGTAADASQTCDLDPATDNIADCPDGCTEVDLPSTATCCTSQVCQCENIPTCSVATDADVFEGVYVDLSTSSAGNDPQLGTRINDWEGNRDDGWTHVQLPFDFNWFGTIERTITIGTNGVLTFGDDQLPYGDSEPVPCQWNGGGQGAGSAGCVQDGGGVSGDHYGVDSIEGIIAVFWCDLNPDVADAASGQGVFYQVQPSPDPRLTAWNRFIVQWIVPVYGMQNLCHFEAVLTGDGTVTLLYLDMPATSGSWSGESIGFEDQTGTKGAQISYGVVPDTSDGPVAYTIAPQCHVTVGDDADTCCSTQICQCEGVACTVQTDAEYRWVEIIDSQLGTRINDWEGNRDDGWTHVQLPFDFNWFGTIERNITIGTNGVLTFGDDQLPYGDSEPVPCQWNGGGQGAGSAGCVQDGGGVSGDHYGVDSIEGIIAVFWCDLNPDVADAAGGEGVYYQIVRSQASQNDAELEAFNRLIVSYTVTVFGTDNLCQFQAILLGDGTVIMQYKDMPGDSGSWSVESIGFEDRTGTVGVQIHYGFSPPVGGTAYRIDPSCHVPADEIPEGLDACCTSRVCECEGVPEECMVDTSLDIIWVDIIATGTKITTWQGNGDDGWYDIDLAFPFNWFGRVERRVTVGTNGIITFGDAQLPYGDSEPVPCQWNGAGQAGGRTGCVQDPINGVQRGGHYGVEIDGIIAVFWCDLNPEACTDDTCGVYYKEIVPADSNRGSGRNLIHLYSLVIEYYVPVFGHVESVCHFEAILSGDGSVLLQYLDMPTVTGSWSAESIGFEDQTGTAGVQIAYEEVPLPQTAFDIPSSCHVSSYNADLNEEGTCCTSQVCMCEDVTCNIETDYTFEWVDIIDPQNRINNTNWQQNADDGWFDVSLPFDFQWFGNVERLVTIGTNGVLSFGSAHLPYGASEPCPCSFGDAACNHGVQMEGVIAPFWADLNPDVADPERGGARGMGVYYSITTNADPRLVSWNKLIVTWDCETFWAANYNIQTDVGHVVKVQVILMADGSLIYQYNEMPEVSGSWSHESIGFEDQSGSKGVQILYGASPPSYTAYHIPPSCHVTRGDEGATTCCTSLICQCEEVQCNIQTDYPYEWVDIIDNCDDDDCGTRIDAWEQNSDDGWFHLELPFDFLWFGNVEQTITIGTNGVLTFGTGQLPYGSSEPCPCSYGDSACNNGAAVEGVIAPFWADLNPSVAIGENGEGVYYKIIESADPVIVAWNKLIIEWRVPTFWAAGYNIQTDRSHMVHLECILMGGGSVLFQYADMPSVSGSWSHESIGFEDRTGSKGVQISYGSTPPPHTAYFIPTACHVTGTEDSPLACCTTQICQCENVGFCGIQTDYQYEWVDIIDNHRGIRINDDMWEQNEDDGWYHVTLPFDFHWFGSTERRITIGTNGVLTFGVNQLPYGSSEPVPCTYGDVSCHGDDNGADGTMSAEGVIAPFWTDLNPGVTIPAAGDGVFYQIINADDPRVSIFNRLIVEYKVPVFGSESSDCHFEAILMADGSVIFQYKDMPADGGWSTESIGFEDRSGTAGVQISYGTVPPAGTAYRIPPSCHTPDRIVDTGCAGQCRAAYTDGTQATACATGCTQAGNGMNFFACSAACHDATTGGAEDACNNGCTLAMNGGRR